MFPQNPDRTPRGAAIVFLASVLWLDPTIGVTGAARGPEDDDHPTLSFEETFDDGDYTRNRSWRANPTWIPYYVPGPGFHGVEITDGALRLHSKQPYGPGGSAGLRLNFTGSGGISVTDDTHFQLDAMPVLGNCNVVGSASSPPIRVSLHLADEARTMVRTVRIDLCYGRVPSDEESRGLIKRFLTLEQGEWSRDIRLRIRDMWRNAHWIHSLEVSGEGLEHDGWIDNIQIGQSP